MAELSNEYYPRDASLHQLTQATIKSWYSVIFQREEIFTFNCSIASLSHDKQHDELINNLI
jgi:hypothetical protein